ncbi:hypothetical protein AALB64_01735 [Lachnospiraceae bacterium 45-P1]
MTMYGEYQFQDGNFVKEAGSGAIPAILTFVQKGGQYILKTYEEKYLKTIGREVAIGDYRDFEHPLLNEQGVSVEVSNKIGENKEISGYPFWIGNVERLEDGIRYRYEMKLEKEPCRIVLTKTEMDSDAVKETFVFDSETEELAP